ncbi:MAG TPA: hypothetical protein VE861_12150 [Gemmatimonadaceae bacterium]|nr:hypothetical protein [Gemmatimonadaceae bacterium]
MSATHQPAPSDRKAAFTGLILGAVFVFIVLLITVKVTNASFAGHEEAKSTSGATK